MYLFIFYSHLSKFIDGRFNGRTVILNVIIILLCVHLYAIHIEGLGALIRGAGGPGGRLEMAQSPLPGGGLEIRVSAPDGGVGNEGFCSRSRSRASGVETPNFT